MKNQKKIISVVLVLCMLFSSMLTISASEYETYVKVSDELLGELNVSYEDLLLGDFEDTGETYPCIIWIEDVKLEEAVEAGIDAAEQTVADDSSVAPYTYSYETTESDVATLVDVTLDDEASDEYVQTYIEAEREAAEEMYSDNNSQFVAENFMARDMSVTYVSKYSPCIFADLSVPKIADLIWENDVVWIEEVDETYTCSTIDQMSDADLQTCLEVIRVDDAKSTWGLTGAGVKIGQIENTCPDVDSVIKNPNADNLLEQGLQYSGVHATYVHSVMSSIAPNATYYASGRYSSDTSTTQGDIYAQIEWLLGQGVNIINMSAAIERYNSYDPISRWLDHLTYNHDVHFVQSAGNDGAYGVMSPGMAYNIITVGNTHWTSPYVIDANSSYNGAGASRTEQRTFKPDIVAPASCTSYATPMVTGTIALLCELQPSLKTKQPIVKAILAAGAGTTTVRYVTSDTLFQQYGAGLVDAWAALYIVATNHYSTSTGVLSSSNTSLTYSMNVTASDSKMRIALSYTNQINLASYGSDHVNITIPNGTIAEVGISVYDPNGNLVATNSSSAAGANLKVIQFATNGNVGTYTIKVTLQVPASDNRSTNVGVAWW